MAQLPSSGSIEKLFGWPIALLHTDGIHRQQQNIRFSFACFSAAVAKTLPSPKGPLPNGQRVLSNTAG